jgi:hypothetical protein
MDKYTAEDRIYAAHLKTTDTIFDYCNSPKRIDDREKVSAATREFLEILRDTLNQVGK